MVPQWRMVIRCDRARRTSDPDQVALRLHGQRLESKLFAAFKAHYRLAEMFRQSHIAHG